MAASLIISADDLVVAPHHRRVDAVVELFDDVAVRRIERADHDPVGVHEVVHGRPLRSELRVRDVADVLKSAIVEPVAPVGPVLTGTVLFIAITIRWSTCGSSSTTVQTADRSASPEYVGGVPTATYTTSAPSTASATSV